MNDSNFIGYLLISGYSPLDSKYEEIDVVVSPTPTPSIVSDETINERNNSSSRELSSTLLEQTGKHTSSTQPGSPGNKNVEEGIDKNTLTRMTTRLKTNKKKSGRRTNKKESASQILLKSHQKKPSGPNVKTKSRTKMTSPYTSNTTSSSTPHRNKSYKVLVVCSYEKGTDYKASRDFISKNFYHKQKVEYTFVNGGTEGTYFLDDIVNEKYNNYFDMIWFAGCNLLKWLFGISFKKLFNTQQARIKRAYDTLKENGIVIFTEAPSFKSKRTGQSISSFSPDYSMTIDNMNSEQRDLETIRIFKNYFTEKKEGTITFYKKKFIVNAGRNAMNLQKRGSQGNKLGASSSSSKRTTRGRETRFEHIFPDSSDRNVPTTSSLHTSSANSSYRPSLSGTPPQTPINISNKSGISCYMDSVIQCLYWTPGFTEMLLSARPRLLNENKNISGYYWDSRYTFQIFREDHSRKSGQELLLLPEGFWRILIALNFLYVIQCYFNNKINLVEEYTKKLIYNLRIYFFKKTGKQGEQDSQDFLSDLFDILTNTYYERDKVTKSEVKVNTAPVPDTVQEAIKENESTQIHSFIQDLFQSTVIKTNTCVYCKKHSFRADFQESFLLEFGEIPPASVSFRELFNRSYYAYVGKDCLNTTECMEKNVKLHFYYIGQGTEKPDILHNDGYLLHTQQMRILKPAKNLIIFFKRFESTADGRINRKINTIVTDISDRINLKDYMYSNPKKKKKKKKDIMYGLYAFIYHRGALDGGHYINYVKIKDQWWFVDDMKKARPLASPLDSFYFHQHLAESYILFYTKIE